MEVIMIGIDKSLTQTLTAKSFDLEVESFVVNSLKVKMIKKLDNLLEAPGQMNARKLFLVPVFTIKELTLKVEKEAPEIKTLFYKELFTVMADAEKQLGI